ncbi:MAG: tetratricopeptide repeat protein [Bacteroidota bacterium]
MMKKTAVLVVAAVAMLATACKNNKETGNGGKNDSGKTAAVSDFKMTPEAERDLKIFRKAWEMADPYTAIYALNSYLMVDSNNLGMKDTLAKLYVETNQPIAALVVIKDYLKQKPTDTAMLVLNVKLAQAMGQPEKSADASKTLMSLFPEELTYKLNYAHSLLMSNGTALEGEKLLNEILSDPRSLQQKTAYNTVENGRQVSKDMSIKVGALMLLGEAYGANGDLDKGEQYFRDVLKVDPKFTPAAEAILQIKKMRR